MPYFGVRLDGIFELCFLTHTTTQHKLSSYSRAHAYQVKLDVKSVLLACDINWLLFLFFLV